MSSMDRSLTESTVLLNAQLSFLSTRLALIHIPLETYSFFTQPILQLLLQNDQLDEDGNVCELSKPWMHWHPFVNVSITPNECSVVCPRDQAEKLFAPVMRGLAKTLRESVSITPDDYSVIAIGGEGLEAGQRVLDLTSPLAMAGIPIFFITTYYSDFILVPFSARDKVIHALEERGFIFEAEANGEAGLMINPSSPLLQPHHRKGSSGSSFDFPSSAGTPPPTSVSELQAKTFRQLERNRIGPKVDRDIRLVTCAGYKDIPPTSSLANFTQGKLQHGLAKCLTSRPTPRFLSLTLTDSESMSITLERHLTCHFHHDGEDLLLGKDGPEQVAITFDLRDLPLESTGIVCGVASRLTDGVTRRIGRELFNMSYLSTAKAGHVIVCEDELDDAMDALEGLRCNGGDPVRK